MNTVLGIDVGGTTVKAGAVDASGQVSGHAAYPTPHDPAELAQVIGRIAAEFDTTGPIGVAVPGIVDEARGVGVWSANLGWHDAPLAELFSEATHRPVVLGHDVRSGAFAEARVGGGGDDLFFVAIGTGISAGVILGGKPVISGGWAGEIGQVKVEVDGEWLPVEKVASSIGLAKRYNAATGKNLPGAREVFDDPEAKDFIWESYTVFGRVLAGAVSALGPVPIRIGGAAGRSGEDLFAPIRTELERLLPEGAVPAISAATLGADAQIIGAALRAKEAS